MAPDGCNRDLPSTPLTLSRGSALLVDEDEKDLNYFAPLLCHLGYAVRSFTNYQEAERCLEHEHFDFVIVNQGSPAFEARRIVELSLTRSRHTPVMVLTRCLEMNCYIEAMQLGAAEYIEKPLSPWVFKHLVTTHAPPREGAISAC